MIKYKFWQKNKKKILNYIKEGHNKSELIQFMGISRSTFYKWIKDNKEFKELINKEFKELINIKPQNILNKNFNFEYYAGKMINYGVINFNNCNFNFKYYAGENINYNTVNFNNCNFKIEQGLSNKI